jgi:hypothetical protein
MIPAGGCAAEFCAVDCRPAWSVGEEGGGGMERGRVDAQWRELAEEALTGMADWRLQHPKATFREIEVAVDERLARLRARMLQDAALASAAADLHGMPAGERPACPACGHRLEARGRSARRLTTSHDQPIELTRAHAVCPACGAGLFPSGGNSGVMTPP